MKEFIGRGAADGHVLAKGRELGGDECTHQCAGERHAMAQAKHSVCELHGREFVENRLRPSFLFLDESGWLPATVREVTGMSPGFRVVPATQSSRRLGTARDTRISLSLRSDGCFSDLFLEGGLLLLLHFVGIL